MFRIYLHFLAGNPHIYAERVRKAVEDRDEAENCIKWVATLYYDCIYVFKHFSEPTDIVTYAL